MIYIAIKNKTTEPFKWVLFGKDSPLPEGIEYYKPTGGLSTTICTTVDDNSQREEYDRITSKTENLIEWMRQHFKIEDIGRLLISGQVVDGMGNPGHPVSFHPSLHENQYPSESAICLDKEEWILNQFFASDQLLHDRVDIIHNGIGSNSIMGPAFCNCLHSAQELSITVAAGEMIRVYLWFKNEKETMGDYMSPSNPSNIPTP